MFFAIKNPLLFAATSNLPTGFTMKVSRTGDAPTDNNPGQGNNGEAPVPENLPTCSISGDILVDIGFEDGPVAEAIKIR